METILKLCNNGDIINIPSIDGANQIYKVIDKRGIEDGHGVGVMNVATGSVDWYNSLTDVAVLVPVKQ